MAYLFGYTGHLKNGGKIGCSMLQYLEWGANTGTSIPSLAKFYHLSEDTIKKIVFGLYPIYTNTNWELKVRS